MSDDLSLWHDAFGERLYGVKEWREMMRNIAHRAARPFPPRRRRLRCLLYGCDPAGPCALWPECHECRGRCTRCYRSVTPKARIVAP